MPRNTPSTPFSGPPPSVRLGLLTQQLLSAANWFGIDQFPAHQIWADDLEVVLSFLDAQQRLPAFFSMIKNVRTARHRDSLLAEARATYLLARNGFAILLWEPPGEGSKKGEALVSFNGSPEIFVEVKQPAWQGEFLPLRTVDRLRLPPHEAQRRLNRMKETKFIPGKVEGGAVGPHHVAMSVVRRNALPKFTDKCANLAIVVDDCMVSPVGFPGLAEYVTEEFLHPWHDPLDSLDHYTYERLGGVLFLRAEAERSREIEYKVDFVENPGALPNCALPLRVRALFSRLRDETEEREEERYAGVPRFLDLLRERWSADDRPPA
jgi:hypothetical protein